VGLQPARRLLYSHSIMPHIFCPTDFTVASHAAFQHALGLTLALRGRLTLMHVSTGEEENSSGFPGIRAQLERWNRLPASSPDSAVTDLGIAAKKVVGRRGDPVDVTLDYLGQHPADLVVLSTHQRDGRARWLGPTVAEPLARGAHAMTLFLPQGLGGFVSPQDGTVRLQRILIPVCVRPAPQPAVSATLWLLKACGIVGANLTLFHAGSAPDMPAVEIHSPDTAPGVTSLARPGDPVEQILAVAREAAADLVVMSTAGHHDFLDALRGSTTERVLRRLECPLLAVPVTRTG
jgi:nucleotide-binding universal stress UspA family protein